MKDAAGETEITDSTEGRGRRADLTARNVWLKRSRTPRDEPTLNRARIVAEAIALLDTEGIERMTMRRLAQLLGHGPTTLYWHVDTKDDVLDLCLDAIYAEVPVPESGTNWRIDVATILTDWRVVMLRHPWSAGLVGRPMVGPNALARMEFLQKRLSSAGLADESLTAATWGLYNHVMGSVVSRVGWSMPDDEREQAQRHLSAHSDRYPTLSAHGYMREDDWDGTFARSLNYLLDGIHNHIGATRARVGRRNSSPE